MARVSRKTRNNLPGQKVAPPLPVLDRGDVEYCLSVAERHVEQAEFAVNHAREHLHYVREWMVALLAGKPFLLKVKGFPWDK